MKFLKFFKNKSFGYYFLLGITVFAFIFMIIFFATYANPDLDPINGDNPMGNKSYGLAPQTIGIFMLAGVLFEIVLLMLPQYRFLQIGAIVMFGLALYKEILIIPDFIAGIINNVMYNGGNVGLNFFYLISLLLIVICAIVVSFFGFYKDEKQALREMNIEKNNVVKIAKIGAGGALVVAAVLIAVLLTNTAGGAVAATFEPITKEVQALADENYYENYPEDVIIKEQATWNYNDSRLNGLNPGMTRSSGNHYLVYYFEGAYAEGYQGDYSETYGYLYLWEDGVFAGKVNDTTFKGFWYNSSTVKGKDEEGNDIADCLNMVSNTGNYESIICDDSTGFYTKQAYVYLGFSWGTRSMILNGFYYYPEIAIAVDTTGGSTKFRVGEKFDRSPWIANRILQNLNYSPILKASEVKWTPEEGMLDEDGNLAAKGKYLVTATWKNGLNEEFETSVVVTVRK